MLGEILKDYHVILASKSLRRQHLLKELEIDFDIINSYENNETFPSGLYKEEIPVYLAELKAKSIMPVIPGKTLLITADTIVWHNGKVVNKPSDYEDALNILHALSGSMHEVITGVCLSTKHRKHTFHTITFVYFANLTEEEIKYYVDKYHPYDKAGAYGIQEWIGYIGIERIEGSYFNVMGLPVQMLYREIQKFLT